MKKHEILWLHNHRCKHRKTYLEHPNCYYIEQPDNNRIGFLDIESTNLKADFGIIICYQIKDINSKTIYGRAITKKELTDCLDKKMVEDCIEDMKKFDRLVTYYGKGFDVPFIRTRAVAMGVPFPPFGEILHDDMYFIMKHRFRLSSNRLENACRILTGATEKTRLDGDHWIKALQGDKEALDYILDHCKKDVLELEKLYHKIINYARRQDTSM